MARDERIKLFRENCFESKEALDICFEKHGDEIIEGHYIPVGMPRGVYESLVKQVRVTTLDERAKEHEVNI